MLTDIHIARFRGGGRPARHSCTTRCQRVAEAAFALDFAFAFVRVGVAGGSDPIGGVRVVE